MLRRLHNDSKRQLLEQWVKPGSTVLDCGCGRGGDWWKWKALNARVYAIDPDAESLAEAQHRAQDACDVDVHFLGLGDIRQAAFAGPYDVVCYNFSIQYIMSDPETFKSSIEAIRVAVKPGGLLIGITPEKARAEMMVDENGIFVDEFYNTIKIHGSTLVVRLNDGPFYADGAKTEPLLDSHILIESLKSAGFEKLVWEPMIPRPNGMISDLYSKFVFRATIRE